jgi:hypothetical protein
MRPNSTCSFLTLTRGNLVLNTTLLALKPKVEFELRGAEFQLATGTVTGNQVCELLAVP